MRPGKGQAENVVPGQAEQADRCDQEGSEQQARCRARFCPEALPAPGQEGSRHQRRAPCVGLADVPSSSAGRSPAEIGRSTVGGGISWT